LNPSTRSPWSNEYDPPLEDGTVPSTKLRKLEVTANEAFDTYRELYYEGGLSSVYLWDLEDGGFAGVVLLKKGAFRRLYTNPYILILFSNIFL
jgi:capping protein (actin filament) muscle Z-line, beta